MSPAFGERTPLLWQPGPNQNYNSTPARDDDPSTTTTVDPHAQFCMMVGVPSFEPTPDGAKVARSRIPAKSLYGRATRQLANQRWTYYGTASLSNTLLLSQVVLGAALTALGASASSHILITVFGALNTIIAGLVAYLKSRGQPMRARMYRDDLERVVDEIENSEVMWLGISRGVHGYEDIDTGGGGPNGNGKDAAGAVTVRSEVARLTRLYDRAVRNNTVNNPDMYMTGAIDGGHYSISGGTGGATLRSRVGPGAVAVGPVGGPVPVGLVAPVVSQPVAPAPVAPAPVLQEVHDPDESPATAPPKPKEEKKKKDGEEVAKPEASKEDETDGKGKRKDEEGETLSKAPTVADKPLGDGAAAEPNTPAPAPAPARQEPDHDPDAEPASDVNVPLKKVAGDAAEGEAE
ncbi:hypothetical protein G647_01931 [Cladophialophora carrionii CBS 160.54]|uniref:SMODS and SLOG-associating 2TM effector domain-containing protein n=1 Tax=Cladophialophora carrionii CBS 160.54 TaxID=1279043 RepID=V9DT29_9EURO|nr:uncharacterized protein G647_01931 [Cladophialophora carrionii CBS 160.54]ETI29478.1 hypothetical protein G647_01931 [Cladophialophora carrionii CBS 160.54]